MLLDGRESTGALETYKAAQLLSEALGFSYRPAGELARQPVEDIVQRVTAIMDPRTPIGRRDRCFGRRRSAEDQGHEAFKILLRRDCRRREFCKSPASAAVGKGKTPAIIRSFAVVEDKAMTDITREMAGPSIALAGQVAPKGGGRANRVDGNRMVATCACSMTVFHHLDGAGSPKSG